MVSTPQRPAGSDAHQSWSGALSLFLASPLQRDTVSATAPESWWIEWKWDGIRGQLIRREEGVFLWSRGEELINTSVPELVAMAETLPFNTVLDGEVICWQQQESRPMPFSSLQRRLGRKRVGATLQHECRCDSWRTTCWKTPERICVTNPSRNV